MYNSSHLKMPCQITGPLADLEELLESEIIPGARRYDLHGEAWIEVPKISEDQKMLVLIHNCKVHYTEISASR